MAAWVNNAWHMAAWANEVPSGGFLARKLLGSSWIIFQRSDESWVMMANRCPHRFAPLSRGQRVGDTIRCGYHGLGFDGNGLCVHSPFPGNAPPNARVRTMPVVDRHGGLWFWPGDQSRAHPDAIPDFSFLDETKRVRARMLMHANYELLTDNLMDLSHTEFLHTGSFGTNGALLEHGRQSVLSDETGAIWNNWDMEDIRAPGWAAELVGDGSPVDQWIHMRWHAPASMALKVGLARAGTGRDGNKVLEMIDPHILTPESENTTHYFYTHEDKPEARALAERVFREEDEPMIRAVYEEMDGVDFWDLRPVILPSDAGALRARRRLMKLRSEENAGEAT